MRLFPSRCTLNRPQEVPAGCSVGRLQAVVPSAVHSVLPAAKWAKALIYTGY